MKDCSIKIRLLVRPLLPIALTIIGVMAIVDGEIDDSPGEMLLGSLIVIYSAYFNFKNYNRK